MNAAHVAPTTDTKSGKPRGFAALTPEQRKEIASKGGKAAHAQGLAHKWTPEEAVSAGRVGGTKSRRRKVVSGG